MKIIANILCFLMLMSSVSFAQKTKQIPQLTEKSKVAIKQKDYNSALSYLVKASDLHPSDTSLAIKVAVLAKFQKETLKSIVYYQRALSNRAKNINLFEELLSLYQGEKQYTEALSVLNKGLTIYPSHPNLLKEKVKIQLVSTSIQSLIQKYEASLKTDSTNKSEAIQILAILYRNAGDDIQAENYTSKLQKQSIGGFEANYQLAVLYYNQAVDIKIVSDRMDIRTYQREGIAIENKAFDKFRESIKYFEKAYAIKKDEGIYNSLIHLYTLLKVEEKNRNL